MVISAGGLSRRRRTWRTIQPDDEPDRDAASRADDEEPAGVARARTIP